MELDGRCFIVDAFPRAMIHSEFWDPWSIETFCHLKIKSVKHTTRTATVVFGYVFSKVISVLRPMI
jgi:hypothetical protein